MEAATCCSHCDLTEATDTSTWLIDPTFCQFLRAPESGGLPIADTLRQTAKGAAFADGLLAKGYARMTPGTARLYLASFRGGEPLSEAES